MILDLGRQLGALEPVFAIHPQHALGESAVWEAVRRSAKGKFLARTQRLWSTH